MLSYLDALCAALLARNSIEVFRLLALPTARQLPREVREEAVRIAKTGHDGFAAPVHALHLYYKLSHLVDESAELNTIGEPEKERTGPQMEFPFRARKAG